MTKNSDKQFTLLKNIIRYSDTPELSVDISKAEQIIKELREKLEKNAPSNFPELYFDFTQEFERFKDFILYDSLIGKNIVALGGGFSSGKSTFLNTVLGKDILPAEIIPSTSVPTYIVYGHNDEAYGINTFRSRVPMDIEDVGLLAHGFGKEEGKQEITLGHLLSNIFISTNRLKFKNLVLLDTPGYSKPEGENYSAKTDENIARNQLNSANYILWFIQSDGGTIHKDDVEFIKALDPDIPKLFILNKADKVNPSERAETVKHVREVLLKNNIKFVDIFLYSRDAPDEPEEYQLDEILEQIGKWEKENTENRFAYNFKVLFTKLTEYYDDLLSAEQKIHSRLQKILADASFENADARDYLSQLDRASVKRIVDIKGNETIKGLKGELRDMQDEFFTEMKRIGDAVHIDMPEPSHLDLIRSKSVDPKMLLDEYLAKVGKNTQKNINMRSEIEDLIQSELMEVDPKLDQIKGTDAYTESIASQIMDELQVSSPRINDCLNTDVSAIQKGFRKKK